MNLREKITKAIEKAIVKSPIVDKAFRILLSHAGCLNPGEHCVLAEMRCFNAETGERATTRLIIQRSNGAQFDAIPVEEIGGVATPTGEPKHA